MWWSGSKPLSKDRADRYTSVWSLRFVAVVRLFNLEPRDVEKNNERRRGEDKVKCSEVSTSRIQTEKGI